AIGDDLARIAAAGTARRGVLGRTAACLGAGEREHRRRSSHVRGSAAGGAEGGAPSVRALRTRAWLRPTRREDTQQLPPCTLRPSHLSGRQVPAGGAGRAERAAVDRRNYGRGCAAEARPEAGPGDAADG